MASRRLAPALLRLLQHREDRVVLCIIRQIARLDLVRSSAHVRRANIGIGHPRFRLHVAFEEPTGVLDSRLGGITHWLAALVPL